MFFPVRHKTLEVGLMDVGDVGCAEHEITEGHMSREGSLARLLTANVAVSSGAVERLPHGKKN